MFWPKKSTAPLESRRAAAQQVARSPDQHHQILDHQGQAEGRQQLKQFRRMIDPPQQHHLDQHADRRDDQPGGDDAAPESDRAGKSLGQRERDIGAEHVERAMGEIDDARHAEDDRQPRRHQKQRRRAGKAGQELNEVKGHLAVRARRIFQFGGFILRDGASRLLRMRSSRRAQERAPRDAVFLFHLAPLAGRGRIASAIRVRDFPRVEARGWALTPDASAFF